MLPPWLIVLLSIVALILILILIGVIRKKRGRGNHFALIRIQGAIVDYSQRSAPMREGNASANQIKELLEQAFNLPSCKGVILEINSPGGSPVAAEEISNTIWRYKENFNDSKSEESQTATHNPNKTVDSNQAESPKIDPANPTIPAKSHPQKDQKPIIAVIRSMGASAAYFIASATDTIYASRFSIVGSIGVLSMRFGFVGLFEKIGVESRTQTAGKFKNMLDPFSYENEEAKAHFQTILDREHQAFIEYVQKGRQDRLFIQKEPDLFTGKFWDGETAQKIGLIDELGDLEDVKKSLNKDYDPKTLPTILYEKKEKRSLGFRLLFDSHNVADVVETVLSERLEMHQK
jgi:protease IV